MTLFTKAIYFWYRKENLGKTCKLSTYIEGENKARKGGGGGDEEEEEVEEDKMNMEKNKNKNKRRLVG